MKFTAKTRALAISGIGLTGLAAGLIACGGSGGTQSPSDILHADGYGTVLTMSENQVQQIAGSGTDLSPYIIGAAYGTNGGSSEIVIQLTDGGAHLISGHLGQLASYGAGYRAHMDGSDLVMVTGP